MTVLNIHINHCWAKSLYYINSCYSVVISSSIFTLLFFNFPCFQGLNFVYMVCCCLLADSVLAILNSASAEQHEELNQAGLTILRGGSSPPESHTSC